MKLSVVFESEWIKVEINEAREYLQTTWLQQPSSEQFREQLRFVVDFALINPVSKALFDIRARAYLEMADQNWLMREIVPLFIRRTLRFAYLVSTTTLAAMDIHRIQAGLEAQPPGQKKLELKVFLDKPEALRWLLD